MKTRTKRKICGAAALAGFVLALGAVGGMEREWLGLGDGIGWMCAGLAAGIAGAWKGGWMR